eukprot:366323-Chlamydomonas_euryale.AAC.4
MAPHSHGIDTGRHIWHRRNQKQLVVDATKLHILLRSSTQVDIKLTPKPDTQLPPSLIPDCPQA